MYSEKPVLPGHPELPEVCFAKEGCNDLTAVVIPGPEGEVISRWKLSDDEMALLVNGGDVFLSVKTFNYGFPPVMLRVATSDMIWNEPRTIIVEEPLPQPPTKAAGSPQQTAISPITSQALAHKLAHEQDQAGQITPPDFQDPVRGKLYFSRYKEDGRLRLYPKGSYISEDPAGYSEDLVTVKVLIVRKQEQFMVCLPVRRAFLDQPEAEKILAEHAWGWRS